MTHRLCLKEDHQFVNPRMKINRDQSMLEVCFIFRNIPELNPKAFFSPFGQEET